MRPRPLFCGIVPFVLAACGQAVTPLHRQAPSPVTPAATAGEPSVRTGGATAGLVAPQRGADGKFPSTLRWGDRDLRHNGTGLCEWGIFGIDLYCAALYCEQPVRDLAAALEPDQRTVLHLQFVRSLTAEQLREAFAASTRANAGDRFGEFAAPLQQLLDAMASVGDGDSYTFGGERGRGLTILRNGTEVGHIADDGFRRLFLQLYLGEQPPTAALRAGLLGGK